MRAGAMVVEYEFTAEQKEFLVLVEEVRTQAIRPLVEEFARLSVRPDERWVRERRYRLWEAIGCENRRAAELSAEVYNVVVPRIFISRGDCKIAVEGGCGREV